MGFIYFCRNHSSGDFCSSCHYALSNVSLPLGGACPTVHLRHLPDLLRRGRSLGQGGAELALNLFTTEYESRPSTILLAGCWNGPGFAVDNYVPRPPRVPVEVTIEESGTLVVVHWSHVVEHNLLHRLEDDKM